MLKLKGKSKKIIIGILSLILVFAIYGSRLEIAYWTNTLHSYFKDPCNNTTYRSDSMEIKILKYPDLPYVYNQTSFSNNETFDLDSVPLYYYHEKWMYQPVFIVQYSFRMLDVYNTTKDTAKLFRVKTIANKLLGISIYLNSSLYFPFAYDYNNHNDKFQKFYAPWYSGMAQGQILSLFVRLYEITNDPKYLNVSHKIFNSFTKLKGEHYSPWTVCVDKENYLWIEEYPSERPCFTLNGMIFGIYGVYDYYRVTKSLIAKNILTATITTIKRNINKYRNEGDISYYCQEENLKIKDYHEIHIEQLLQLYKITNDRFFLNESLHFKSDTEKIK